MSNTITGQRPHDADLNIIARHMDSLCVLQGFVDPLAGRRYGQRPDYFGWVTEAIDHAWTDRNGVAQRVWPGLTVVADHKRYRSDLKKDRQKQWHRQPSFGKVRLYWMRRDAEIRPEHVDEEWGWGAVVFDDDSFDLVLPPVIAPDMLVAHDAEKHLISQLMHQRAYQSVAVAMNKSGVSAKLANELQSLHIDLPASKLDELQALMKADQTAPWSAGDIKSVLGVRTNCDKLVDQLRQLPWLGCATKAGKTEFFYRSTAA